jgi:hypothetical protein
MKHIKEKVIDKAGMVLVASAAHVQIDVPAKVIKEMLKRPEFPWPASRICGFNDVDEPGFSLVEEYLNMQGYHFSWGILAESVFIFEECKERLFQFEFFFDQLVIDFPRPDLLETFFIEAASMNPQMQDSGFHLGEANGMWFVFGFEAFGKTEESKLRRWLAKFFIPTILPQLILEVEEMISNHRKNGSIS